MNLMEVLNVVFFAVALGEVLLLAVMFDRRDHLRKLLATRRAMRGIAATLRSGRPACVTDALVAIDRELDPPYFCELQGPPDLLRVRR